MDTRKTLHRLVRASAIAALYVLLTFLSSLFGISSGAIQCRLSEALAPLPLLFPEATFGLCVGCFLANLLTGGTVADLFLGALATLLGALGTRLLKNVKFIPLATLPTVLANTLIIPFVIIFFYEGRGELSSFPAYALTVGIGEVISVSILGTGLYYAARPVLLKIQK